MLPRVGRRILPGLMALLVPAILPLAQEAELDRQPGVRRVEVKSVLKSADLRANAVLLKDLKTGRLLPVWIGPFEADAIQMKLGREAFARPLTHDLLKSLIAATGAKVRYVLIDALRSTSGGDWGTYFAKISLSLKGGVTTEVDSRTSDAIALSLRTGTPIYISTAIMDANSIPDEKDLEREMAGEPAPPRKGTGKPAAKQKNPGNEYY